MVLPWWEASAWRRTACSKMRTILGRGMYNKRQQPGLEYVLGISQNHAPWLSFWALLIHCMSITKGSGRLLNLFPMVRVLRLADDHRNSVCFLIEFEHINSVESYKLMMVEHDFGTQFYQIFSMANLWSKSWNFHNTISIFERFRNFKCQPQETGVTSPRFAGQSFNRIWFITLV